MIAPVWSSLTESQRAAVSARGQVVVTAGAGTGKTMTLAARCADWVWQQRVSLEEILMVTFTDAAATEMRLRIRQWLDQTVSPILTADLARHLQEQRALLDTAPISTLHGFCLRLLREHFHELGLDPQFRVLAPGQLAAMTQETWERLIAPWLEGASAEAEAFQQLVHLYGRSDPGRIQQLVLRIHHYAQSLPQPDEWYEAQLVAFRQTRPAHWEGWLLSGFESWRQRCLDLFPPGIDDDSVAQVRRALCSRNPCREPGDIPFVLGGLISNRAGRRTRTPAAWLASRFKQVSQQAVFWQSLVASPEALAEDWAHLRRPLASLLAAARGFGRRFAEAKRAAGGLDFSDLEQGALQLLWDFSRQRPTRLAEHVRERFRLVFVDEYQDINAVQDAIIQAVSREGAEANLFIVGDAKQSIYRFRLADPRIFRRRMTGCVSGASPGQLVALQENFRSHREILAFANRLFRFLMPPSAEGVVFGPNDELRSGFPAEEAGSGASGPWRVQLHLVSPETEGEASEADATGTRNEEEGGPELAGMEKEAYLAAGCLRRLREQPCLIMESGGGRQADWRDMAILLRSPKSAAGYFVRAFAAAGIPLQPVLDSFLDSAEVQDLIHLLVLLDNPIQDLRLLATLRSPLVALTPDEMALCRIYDRRNRWWPLLRRCQKEWPALEFRIQGQDGITLDGREAWGKIDLFLARYQSWRRFAKVAPLTHLLEKILADTGYEAMMAAHPAASERLANLHRLLQLTRQFDPFQRQGLNRFLQYLESQSLEGEGKTITPSSQVNAVRLLSIHGSKGLEYPIVLLAGLGKPFNLNDLKEPVILDEDYGICAKVIMTRGPHQAVYPSLPWWLARQRQHQELRQEELRLLYVAVTRAKEYLLLLGTPKAKARRSADPKATPRPDLVTAYDLQAAKDPLHWLLLWQDRIQSSRDWREQAEGRNAYLEWHWHEQVLDLVSPTDVRPPGRAGEPPSEGVPVEKLDALRRRLQWGYPWPGATVEPAKSSASELRRRNEDARSETSFAAPFLKYAPESLGSLEGNALSSADIGVAYHTFLQWLDLGSTAGLADLSAEADRLTRNGVLTSAERQVIDVKMVWDFWQTELGRRALGQAGCLRRELPFTARFSAADLTLAGWPPAHPLSADEFIVIQGVIDLAVLLPGEIWLVDYKTDVVTAEEAPEHARAYVPQLHLYATALGRIYRRPVTEVWLYFLRARACVRLAGVEHQAGRG